jgi:hypothetical protein
MGRFKNGRLKRQRHLLSSRYLLLNVATAQGPSTDLEVASMQLESMSRGRTWTLKDRLEIRKPALTSLGIDPGKALLGIGYNLPNEPSQATDQR